VEAAAARDRHRHAKPAGGREFIPAPCQAHGYRFEIGALQQVDPAWRSLLLAPLMGHDGEQILPERAIPYCRLVLALGSEENDFGTPGARAHCLFLNTTAQAVRTRDALLTGVFRIARGQQRQLSWPWSAAAPRASNCVRRSAMRSDALRVHEPGLDRARVRLTVIE
jgi:NADH dehydrogenase